MIYFIIYWIIGVVSLSWYKAVKIENGELTIGSFVVSMFVAIVWPLVPIVLFSMWVHDASFWQHTLWKKNK